MEEDLKLPEYWNLTPWEFAKVWGDGLLYTELPGRNTGGSRALRTMDDSQRDYYAFLSLAKSLKRIEEALPAPQRKHPN